VQVEAIIGIALAGMAAFLNAVAIYILRLHWSEIVCLRRSASDLKDKVTAHGIRIDYLERGGNG
jgi:hypothetical protein